MSRRIATRGVLAKSLFAILVFAVLLGAIGSRVPKRLNDFDQSFYLTIAYDMQRHGVFSNGIFDDVDSTSSRPQPGMFFVPVYPALILLAMKLDRRFADAVECAVLANHKKIDGSVCDIYARPINILHAALLTVGVLVIAATASLIIGAPAAFFVAGLLSMVGLVFEAELFSYIMTESISFGLFSLFGFLLMIAIRDFRALNWAAVGFTLGILCLCKPSFMALAPVTAIILCVRWWFHCPRSRSALLRNATVCALGFALVIGPWIARNGLIVGKWGLTEEYGAAALVERFSYNDMTVREAAFAFPYCLPVIGAPLVNVVADPQDMARFEWDSPGGFFEAGRARRNTLLATHTKLDPVFGGILRDELRANGIRHLLVSIPLAWCGAWVSGAWSLFMIPLFVVACFVALRRRKPLLLYYAAPAVVMIALHAAVANHYSRYNLGFIGPLAVGAAALLFARRDAPASPNKAKGVIYVPHARKEKSTRLDRGQLVSAPTSLVKRITS